MLKLYHGKTSVCSQKARLGFAEKKLAFESVIMDLGAGDQFQPAYLKLNPNAVVPTLVDDGKVVIESSVILQYLDDVSPEPPLMPKDGHLAARVRTWLLRTLEIHASTNSLSFATAGRIGQLKIPKEEREANLRRMPDPAKADKRRDLIDNGVASHHVDDAIRAFGRVFHDMETDLLVGPWLMGDRYTLAEPGLFAYVDRIDRLGLDGFWKKRHPRVGEWFERNKARPSYQKAIEDFVEPGTAPKMRAAGGESWPIIEKKLAA